MAENVRQAQNYDYLVRLLVLGPEEAGKSNFVMRFAENRFNPGYTSTIGTDFQIKAIKSPVTSKILMLQIWDFWSRHIRNPPSKSSFYRRVQGFFILFDCTDRENSFQRVPKYFEELTALSKDDVPKILVATKIDLAAQRQVSFEEAKQLADQLGVPYIETSAKNDINVSEAYHVLVRRVERLLEKKQTSVPNLAPDVAPPEPNSRCTIM